MSHAHALAHTHEANTHTHTHTHTMIIDGKHIGSGYAERAFTLRGRKVEATTGGSRKTHIRKWV